MNLRTLAVTFVLVQFAGSAPAGAANILLNPGFETGTLGPWFEDRVFSGTDPWTVTDVFPHTGTFSATVDGNREIRQDFAAVSTDLITEISFWAAHPNPNVSDLFVDFFYSDGSDTGFLVFTAGSDYNFFDVTSFLEGGKELTGFSIFGNSTGVTYFDDAVIDVNVVPEASTLAMGSIAAMIGLAAARRRGRRSVA